LNVKAGVVVGLATLVVKKGFAVPALNDVTDPTPGKDAGVKKAGAAGAPVGLP